ncbi:MAG: hypothetical protein ACKO6N_08975 [Myxococcota bacterium]
MDSASNVGLYSSLIFDAGDVALIAYQDSTNLDLKVARAQQGTWSLSTVDSTGSTGYWPSISRSAQGRVAIAYNDNTSYYRLRYAELSSGTWSTQTALSVSSTHVSAYPLMTWLDEIPMLSSFRYQDNSIQATYFASSTWVTTRISNAGTAYSDYRTVSATANICGEPVLAYSRVDPYVGNYYLALQTF